MLVGIDLEQFVRDPQSSGIQRVLQNLARSWPVDVEAKFVMPFDEGYALLDPNEAADLVDRAFMAQDGNEIREFVRSAVNHLSSAKPQFGQGQLLSMFTAWLLPEVSYLPTVLERFEIFRQSMPTTMICYDTLPMTEPDNYRFTPGTGDSVSWYFRLLTQADSVVCISEFARESLLTRLRRDRRMTSLVAHPGGDHEPSTTTHVRVTRGVTTFVKLGTLEARKKPLEILSAFRAASSAGLSAELIFIGRPSASDPRINATVAQAVADGVGVRWLSDASDSVVREVVRDADYLVSIGVEGYGIPVLEAIRAGTPVLFHGVQPAAELMVGKGAIALASDEQDGLRHMFVQYCEPENWQLFHEQVDPQAVPTWASFSEIVARAATSDLRI